MNTTKMKINKRLVAEYVNNRQLEILERHQFPLTPMNNISNYIYEEAAIIAKNDPDVQHELYLKGMNAVKRFDPNGAASLTTYVSKVMQKSQLSIVRKTLRISQREAYDVDLTLFMAPERKSFLSREFEDEELRHLYRLVMGRLNADERLIVLAMLKARARQKEARALLKRQGLDFSAGTFCTKILPALKAKVKGIIG